MSSELQVTDYTKVKKNVRHFRQRNIPAKRTINNDQDIIKTKPSVASSRRIYQQTNSEIKLTIMLRMNHHTLLADGNTGKNNRS